MKGESNTVEFIYVDNYIRVKDRTSKRIVGQDTVEGCISIFVRLTGQERGKPEMKEERVE
jgi:hypothetical protein